MKRTLKLIIAVILCVGMITSLCPSMAFAESAPDYTLKFKNGKFKILVLADCQDDSNPDQKMITMIGKALDYEKPDIVVFLGDNVVTTTQTAFKTGLKKLMAPLVARNVPYAYVFGNHDDQSSLITKSFMHGEYQKVGTCLTYDAEPDLTGLGNCNLPVMSSNGNSIAFNLWMIDSNTYTDSSHDYYDNVHSDQLNWYRSKSIELENQAGHKVNSLVFQHIIVPEAYNLLVENPNGGKTYNGKTYDMTLNSYASGYLGEWPCPPRDNSGELNTMAARGDVLGIVTGHDHKNSFIGRWNGVDLIQTAGMTFESYGDDAIRGYRTITINENDTSHYETSVVTYTGEAAGDLNPVATGNGVPDEYCYQEGTQFISDVAIGYGTSKKDPALNALTSSGFTPIVQDLNGGAGGAYIYMGYKLTSNYAESLKALRFSVLGEGGHTATKTSVINNNNVTFNLVSEGADGIVDLNKDAGGAYIYTYYTKDPLAGSAVTSISFDSSSAKPASGETATTLSNVACPAELNAGTGGSLIYCHYTSSLTKVNSSALRSAYNSTAGLNASNYTTASYNALQTARNAAKVIIDKLNAEHASTYTQTAINSAATAINNAYANLAHTVTYKNYDGSVITTEEVIHGRAAAYSGVPTRTGTAQYDYSFKGWSADLSSVTSNMTVTAQYNQTLKSYNVTFKNGNEVLQSSSWEYGETPSYTGAVPQRDPTDEFTYEFAGWSPEIATVTGDATYTAVFTPVTREYTVTFKNGDEVLQSSSWEYGETPSYKGAVPQRDPTDEFTYIFAGWSPSITDVTGDAAYSAVFTPVTREYTVTFKNGDEVLQSSSWEYGETPSYTGAVPQRDPTDEFTYEFAGWSPSITSVTGNAAYSAVFNPVTREYTVTFKNGDEVLQSSSWEYGETPSYTGAAPQKESTDEFTYEFAGWSPEIAAVTGDATYTAVFTPVTREYTVTFKNGNEVLQSSSWEYGETPSYKGAVPQRDPTDEFTYEFAGWSPEITDVTGDAAYSAVFTPVTREYTVTFKNGDEVLQSSSWEYGETPSYKGEAPQKESTDEFAYEFAGWSPEIVTVTGDATYTAVFTPVTREYNITFKNFDGEILQEGKWAYGSEPEYKGQTPEKPEDEYAVYNFIGWSPEIADVTGEAVYNAQFSTEYKSYTYKFYVDGAEIPEFEITQVYGTAVTAPVYTPAEGYEFSGWSAEVPASMGTENLDFYGTTSPKTVTVSFDLNGGTGIAPKAVMAAFGSNVTLPAQGDITRTGFDFKGWAMEANAAEPISEFIAPASDVTLYAVWTVSAAVPEPELEFPEGSEVFISEEKMQICGLPEGTTVKALQAELTVDGGYAEIESASRNVGTGTIVSVYDNDGNLVKSYTVIIFGDLDGNGRVTASDVALARQALTEGFEDSVYEAAANIVRLNKRDRFNPTDIAALMSALTYESLDQVELAQIYEQYG